LLTVTRSVRECERGNARPTRSTVWLMEDQASAIDTREGSRPRWGATQEQRGIGTHTSYQRSSHAGRNNAPRSIPAHHVRRPISLCSPHPRRKRRCHQTERRMSSSRYREASDSPEENPWTQMSNSRTYLLPPVRKLVLALFP